MALYKHKIVAHGIELYVSVQTWDSDSVQAWYSISIINCTINETPEQYNLYNTSGINELILYIYHMI